MITKNSIKRKPWQAFVSQMEERLSRLIESVPHEQMCQTPRKFAIRVMGQISALFGSSISFLSSTPQRSAQLIQSLLMTLEGDSVDKCNYTGNKGAAN